jgi:hypothetical protein
MNLFGIYSVSFLTMLKYDILDCKIIIDNLLDRTLDFWLWRIPPCHIWRFAIDGWNMIGVWISFQYFFLRIPIYEISLNVYDDT